LSRRDSPVGTNGLNYSLRRTFSGVLNPQLKDSPCLLIFH